MNDTNQWPEMLEIADRFREAMKAVKNSHDLEELRLDFIGRRGSLTALQAQMKSIAKEDKPAFGKALNSLRQTVNAGLEELGQEIKTREQEAKLASERLDLSLPPAPPRLGARHPITQTIDEMIRIFAAKGYSVAEGPEVEWTKKNFDDLNLPEHHPAREPSDTFYITDDILLRTQTSPVQIRVMQEQRPPIYIICPGKVYRPDTPDATHSPVFHQVEGLVVDRGITMGDLNGTLKYMAESLFGSGTKIRLRPHYFPFTEPSCEVDVSCWNCRGVGCPTCKDEGFIEILGAGMVHPNVLKECGIDPEIYSGFAFGIGAERTAMARHRIKDIRSFAENDVRFLRQFKA